MFGNKQFDLICFLTLLFFCLVKKSYEILVKKNKTTQVVLFLQLALSLIILIVFKLSFFTLLILLMLIMFSHIFIVDIREYVIPYSSLIGLLLIGIVNLFIENNINISIISRLLSFAFFLLLWGAISFIQVNLKKEFLGGGDMMLFCVVSLILGGTITFIGIFIASLLALIFHILRKDKNKMIPFGPYLVMGFMISLLISKIIFNYI